MPPGEPLPCAACEAGHLETFEKRIGGYEGECVCCGTVHNVPKPQIGKIEEPY